MLRVGAGDEGALSELYDRHASLVFNLARAVVGDDPDAEEATEDVFLQLWTGADRFDPARGTLRAWLATMTRSRALDLVRARERRQATVERAAARDEGGVAVVLSEPAGADESVLRVEVRDALDRALAMLNDDQRRAIELAYFGGLTQSEIAEHLAEPLGTVKTRIRDGMARLRDSFQGGRGLLA
jgi:RNA polymerase sigma-70 factor (ECF subfamily)